MWSNAKHSFGMTIALASRQQPTFLQVNERCLLSVDGRMDCCNAESRWWIVLDDGFVLLKK
jgi:hypothetical protein